MYLSAHRRSSSRLRDHGSAWPQAPYLADEAGAEVFLAHHHDKVVVSIPDAGTREKLLRELGDASWLFTDVSGYGSSMDGEDEEEEDPPA